MFIIHTMKYPLHGYILGVLMHTTAWDRLWGGNVFLRLYIRSSALPPSVPVWLAFWNSDLVVLKSSIRTSASPRQQRSHWGLRVTQDVYFSLLTHTKQLLLVTFCHTTAGNGASFRTHRRNDGQNDGRTEWRTDGQTVLRKITKIVPGVIICVIFVGTVSNIGS